MAARSAAVRSRTRPVVRAETGLIDPTNFLLATRDSGYRSTAFVVAEFIDNAIQAGATRVDVSARNTKVGPTPIELQIVDDGSGMDADELAAALAFGGSSRFNDRSSLGRYGMGLPNGGLSRARRIEVYSWRGDTVLHTWLDLDEVLGKGRRMLPAVCEPQRDEFVAATESGTAVMLKRCDRLEYRRLSSLTQRLRADLGRIYRRYIRDGLAITVDGASVQQTDPLLLETPYADGAASVFGDELMYTIKGRGGAGEVTVRFSELPVSAWHALPSDEKRRRGITHGPTVSVLRAGREVDSGWFFMGSKRRENYDDWWRCEINFDPSLDELFGITHAKQSIVPAQDLRETLQGDLEPIARALNARVRAAFESVKLTARLSDAECQAAKADASLPPRRVSTRGDQEPLRALARELLGEVRDGASAPYRIGIAPLPTTAAFDVLREPAQLVLLLNSRHPLIRDLYEPLALSDAASEQQLANRVVLALLAAARAEEGLQTAGDTVEMDRFRSDWADVIATFFNATT